MTVILALVLSLVALAAPASAGAATSSHETQMISAINATRADHGLKRLRPVAGMMGYAGRHSGAMAARGALYHTPSFSVICCWTAVAENVGMGSSVASLHRAFMNSPGHRANLLNGSLRQVGIGIVSSGDRMWVTEVFRRPA